jgi:hypothetical protein
MTYFEDLSRYTYHEATGIAVPAKNVGWLDRHHSFAKEEPSSELLDAVWKHCFILVVPTRGLHTCEFCTIPSSTFVRHGSKLLLGSGEIRVFNSSGDAFAAPNLIYHYISDHWYRPPREFVQAIEEGPRPGNQEYQQRFDRPGLDWRENPQLSEEPKQMQFARTENGVEVKNGKVRN